MQLRREHRAERGPKNGNIKNPTPLYFQIGQVDDHGFRAMPAPLSLNWVQAFNGTPSWLLKPALVYARRAMKQHSKRILAVKSRNFSFNWFDVTAESGGTREVSESFASPSTTVALPFHLLSTTIIRPDSALTRERHMPENNNIG